VELIPELFSRAFWDQTAAGGQGGEFSQIIDTFIFLKANLSINTSNFTGDADKVPICEVDVDGGGVITAIREGRSQLFRLGRPGDVNFDFAWSSRTEPIDTQFTGADKDINDLKEWMDAVMSRIRENSGTTFWYEAPGVSLTGAFVNAALSAISGLTSGARFSWSGTALSITDDKGGPADADAIAAIRLFSSSANLRLTRMDGTGGSTTIAIADDEVLWIEFSDPLANTDYDDIGLAQTNYRISARGSVPLNDSTFWLAYREGPNIYVRGLGELEPNESAEISDNINENILAAIGLVSEVASPNYTAISPGSLNLPNYNTVTNESIISRVAKVTAMLADIRQDLNIELDPGTIVWDGANIDITGAQLSIPGTTVGTAPVSINNIASVALADNEALFVDISRTSGAALTLAQATLVSLTPSQQRLIMVRRIGSDLLVR